MNSKFKITIPKPCHENWNKMTSKEKGRFCTSCAKTVIDFTKKSTTEIQDYLVKNKNERVCGHFYKKQLDTITIEIPQITFQQQLSFQKLFILALFFVMGTTLFSCQYADGKKQKIDTIILLDTIETCIEKIDSFKITIPNIIDTVGVTICDFKPKKDNLVVLTKMGDIEEILETEGEIILQEEIITGILIEETAKFKESKGVSKEKARKDFNEKMKEHLQNNFDYDTQVYLGLEKGKYKIYTQFTIDDLGNVIDIKVRALNLRLKKEVIKMLKKLPQFISGKQRNKAVKTKYTLPISFEIK